jgi:Beta-lactamase inhibitor (BLIP).
MLKLPRYNFPLSAFFVLLVAGLIFTSCGKKENAEGGDAAKPETEASSGESAAAAANMGLTYDAFKAISLKMSYDDVKKVFGEEGKEQSNLNGVIMYSWKPKDGVIMCTFTKNELTEKKQNSFEKGMPNLATMDKFNQLKDGMALDEVEKIMGGEGQLIENAEFYMGTGPAQVRAVYKWIGEKASKYMDVTFEDGKLSSKEQKGLE